MTRLTRVANDFNNAHTINLRACGRVRICVRVRVRASPCERDENFQLVMLGTWKLCWKLFHCCSTRRSDERMKSPCLMASKNNERFQRYKL